MSNVVTYVEIAINTGKYLKLNKLQLAITSQGFELSVLHCTCHRDIRCFIFMSSYYHGNVVLLIGTK